MRSRLFEHRIEGAGELETQRRADQRQVGDARQNAEPVDGRRLSERDLDLVHSLAGDGRHVFYRQQPAVAHERHPAADPLHLGQLMGREKDGPAAGPNLVEHAVELVLDEGIEAGRRLVQDQQVRSVHERLDEGDLALVAGRKLPHLARKVARKPLGQLIDERPIHPPSQRAEEAQVLPAGEPAVQSQLAGDVADATARLDALRARVQTEQVRRTGARPDEVQQYADGGRLAGPIGTQKAEDLAHAHLQVEVGHAALGAVELGQLVGADGGAHRGSPPGRRSRSACQRSRAAAISVIVYV